jgi:hypothetical protein
MSDPCTVTVARLTYAVSLLAFVSLCLACACFYLWSRVRRAEHEWSDRDRDSDARRIERMRALAKVEELVESVRRLDD